MDSLYGIPLKPVGKYPAPRLGVRIRCVSGAESYFEETPHGF